MKEVVQNFATRIV